MYSNESQSPTLTAFRAAEKHYQLHKDEIIKIRRGKRKGAGFKIRPTDLSELIDVDAGSGNPGVEPASLAGVPSALPPCAATYAFPAHPGLLLVRQALSTAQQRQLTVDALTVFPEPPGHTNHTLHLGQLPGLWQAAQACLRLLQQQQQPPPPQQQQQQRQQYLQAQTANVVANDCNVAGPDGHRAQSSSSSPSPSSPPQVWSEQGSGPTARALLRKLRWATLGPPFDWTNRVYLRDAQYRPLPAYLQQLAGSLAALADQLGPGASSQPEEQQQQQQGCFDAAIVNYYYEGDTLGGHKDDAEQDLSRPIVAVSLGCPAVFLMGSHTRDTPPTALLLRSGDAVVLSGPARSCYHGVPRVFTDAVAPTALECRGDGDPFWPFAQHMLGCRINISIRHTC